MPLVDTPVLTVRPGTCMGQVFFESGRQLHSHIKIEAEEVHFSFPTSSELFFLQTFKLLHEALLAAPELTTDGTGT
ncbi:hypothetical protein PG994_007497 [Apiospora phragmitis]|uniref:Uncharacterized protein n=1 Tax=Apiospora phragmitis TaxID=2905665 RepID=A0ABR1V0Y9_9PEZI